MTFPNLTAAPDRVEQLAQRLRQTDTVAETWAMREERFWYPTIDLGDATLPACVLFEDEPLEVILSAADETSERGRVHAVFYFPVDADDTYSMGVIEEQARAMLHEMLQLTDEGLMITSATRSRASDVKHAQRAASEDVHGRSYRSVEIVASYEG